MNKLTEEAYHFCVESFRLARWRDLCLDKIDGLIKAENAIYDLWRKTDTERLELKKRIAAKNSRIAELEAQLATVKDDCANRAADYFKAINYDLEMTNFSRLRAAIKGE